LNENINLLLLNRADKINSKPIIKNKLENVKLRLKDKNKAGEIKR
jgi:hypothetical protein